MHGKKNSCRLKCLNKLCIIVCRKLIFYQSLKLQDVAVGSQPSYTFILGLLRSPLLEELPPDEGGPLSLTHAHRACELPGWKYCLGTPIQSLFMPPLQ